MTTIKSYTDLQQSKKLAKILSLESADMSWVGNGLGKPFARTIPIKGDPEELCACWSLAALLEVVKIDYKLEKSLLDQSDYFTYALHNSDNEKFRTHEYGNPIDACVEMIEKLHEEKLL